MITITLTIAWSALAVLSGFLAPLSAAPLVLPREEYRTIRTEHFLIHFPADRKDAALYIAAMAEGIHSRLEPRFRSGAHDTHLVLIFRSDLINAYTTVYGMDRILLYMAAPASGDFARYRDWIEQLLVHEYVHILTLRPYMGFWNTALRLIIGVSPNILAPDGLTEGYAVREESRDGTGRLDDPQTNAIRDVLALSDRFPRLEEAMTGTRRWPYGAMPYLFGGRFVSFLRNKCGEDRLDAFFLSAIPAVFPSWRLSSSDCGSIDALYDEYVEQEKAAMRNHLAARGRQGVTPRQRLTFDGGAKRYLLSDPAGMFFFGRPEGRSPGIYSLDARDPTVPPRASLFYRATSVAGFYLDRGVPVTAEPDEVLQGSIIRNVLRRDGARIYDDDGRREGPAGRGKDYVYIRRQEPFTYLINGRDERVMLRLPESAWMGQPAVESDANGSIVRVAVVVKRPGSTEHALVVCENDTCREFLTAKGTIATPSFSPDGRIVFASDVDGVLDIFAANRSGDVQRLTRSLTGFSDPALREDGLYVVGSEADGNEIFRVLPGSIGAEPASDLFQRGSVQSWIQSPTHCALAGGGGGAGESSTPYSECLPDALAGPAGFAWPGRTAQPAYLEWRDPASVSPYRPFPGSDVRIPSLPYNGLMSFQPFMNGLLGGPLSYFSAGMAGYDPLSRHALQAGVGMYDGERSYNFLSYSYTALRPDFTLSYVGMPLDRPPSENCAVFKANTYARAFCDGERRFSFQESSAAMDLTVAHRLLRNHFSLSATRSLYRNTSDYALAVFSRENLDLTAIGGSFDVYYSESSARSISAERGFVVSGAAEYLPSGATRTYGSDGRIIPLTYQRYQGSLDLFLPFFIDYHVPVVQAYTSLIAGKDSSVEETRLSSVLPGLVADRSPYGKAINVYGFEYRFPIWQTRHRLLPWFPSLGIRYMSLAPFAATGQARSVYDVIDPSKWVNTAGVRLNAGLYAFYQPFEIRVTYARGAGPAGEGQVSFGFSIGALPSSYGGPASLRRQRPACPDGSCLNR